MILAEAEIENLFSCCAITLGVFLIVFWIVQFIDLMNCKDSVFPGRYDKLIWALALISLNIIGAILFWFWKQGTTARTLASSDVREILKQAGIDTDKTEQQ